MKKTICLTIMAMAMSLFIFPSLSLAGEVTLIYTANTRGEIDPVVV